MKVYQDESGRLITIGQLYDEFQELRAILRNFLQTAGITYELSGDANQMFSHFEILATEQIARRINEFLEEVTV